ncbi:hypothetical protein CB0940_04894 [Cercospora beticola]|uniref:Uncharacterized protein n=1 Tax=Cercospora beticola TaxID=122368 RepID=A0A2G5HJ30_CERBT|nr:hypothetical protein CB0940_04894 [Cercospora beticola]PIA92567.1 hypothetical protein CB0940_04894 [Cercospora beticola]WPB02177.1 hypothetical protein RHO25_006811 [Cercospora beticola]CAK1362964.1 unnamed protein product [Cercospora beticola]
MARSSQTSYRTNSSVKPTEREVRAYRVEQADRILLERVANVRSTLMQPRVGKRSSAGPYAPRGSSSAIQTSNTAQNHASATSNYSASTFQSSTRYQSTRRQARRQQFRPLGGVHNSTYSLSAHLHESTSYLDKLERTAQHQARKNAESEAMFQENKQRREQEKKWQWDFVFSPEARRASEDSKAAAAKVAHASANVEHGQQLPAESKRVSSIGAAPQETHDTQDPPNEQVFAQETDRIHANEAQQAEVVEAVQVGSMNEEVAQYSLLSFSSKVKKVKKQIIVGSALAATFPAVSRQVFQRVLYTDGTRAWIKVQVQGNGVVEAEAFEALPEVRKRPLLVEHELEEPRKRQLTAKHAFQCTEEHKFADEMPVEFQREDLDQIDGSVVPVEEGKETSPEELDEDEPAIVLFEEGKTTSEEVRDEAEVDVVSLREVKTSSEEERGETGLGIVHVEEVKTISTEHRHGDASAIVPHEEAKGASEGEHIEADAAGFHIEEREATSEEERREKEILDVVSSNEGAPQEEEEEMATVEDDHDPYRRQRMGQNKITSSTKRATNQKGDCVDCGKRTYDQPHVCYNRHPKRASSGLLHSRQARIHVDAKGAEKIHPGIEPVIPLVGRGTFVSESAMAFARNVQLFDAASSKRTANGEAQQNATEDDEDLMDVGEINSTPANAPTEPRSQSSGGHDVPQREGSMDVVSTFEAFDEMLPPAATGLSARHQVYQGPDSGVGSLISDQDEDMVMSGTDAQVEEEEEEEVMSGVEHTAPQQDVQVRKSLFFAAPIGPRDNNDSSHRHQLIQESLNAPSLGQEQYFRRPAHWPGDRDGDIDMIDDTPSTRQAPARHGRSRPQAEDRYGNIDMPDASAAPSQLPRRQNNRARDHRQFVGDRQFVDRQYNAIMSHTRTAPNRQPLRMRDTNFSDSGRRGAHQHYRPQRSLSTTPSTQHNLYREDYARQRMAADAQRRAGARGADRPPRRNATPSRTNENDIGLRIRGAAKMRGESMRDGRYAD